MVYSPGFNAGFTRARQLLNIHDLIHLQIDSERSLAKTLYYELVVRAAIVQAGVVMTVSETSASAIANWLRAPQVNIVNVGCGRSEVFTPADCAKYARPTFVYVGNLKPHKNTDVLFRALALRKEYALIVVCGDAKEAKARVQHLDLERQVTVRSRITDPELATIYRSAAGVVQPSLLEGFGLPALESMSCGTRVAHWSGCESVAEICAGEGIAVEAATDPAEWALALDALVDASSTPLQMQDEWTQRYTWDSVASKVSQTLSTALG